MTPSRQPLGSKSASLKGPRRGGAGGLAPAKPPQRGSQAAVGAQECVCGFILQVGAASPEEITPELSGSLNGCDHG